MKIETIGKLRKFTNNLDDDFKFNISIMKKLPETQLAQMSYPYPWIYFDADLYLHDVSYLDKEICLGVYQKEQKNQDIVHCSQCGKGSFTVHIENNMISLVCTNCLEMKTLNV